MYTLTSSPNIIVRDSDNAFIPTDSGNRDYREYLDWVAQGNTPNPYVPPAPTIPQVVTAYQAKMALASANLYSTVENTVNTSTDLSLKIAWNNASTFDRQSPFIISIGQQLGISNTEIDQLFISASKIT